MLTVALTGNIASGKSEVARALVERGAVLIDADRLAREVVEPGTPGLSAIVQRWGGGILDASGRLDRAALRRIVFADDAERAALEAIVHPQVEARRRASIQEARASGASIVVCDIPLLFEKQMQRAFDVVVLVDAPTNVRLARIVERRGLARDEAMRMIASQMPATEKRRLADIIVENDGTLEELASRVDDLWRELLQRARTREGSRDSAPA